GPGTSLRLHALMASRRQRCGAGLSQAHEAGRFLSAHAARHSAAECLAAPAETLGEKELPPSRRRLLATTTVLRIRWSYRLAAANKSSVGPFGRSSSLFGYEPSS